MPEEVLAPIDSLDPDTSPPAEVVRLHFEERLDPEAAGALWALILNPHRPEWPSSGDGVAGR